ncbi:MAG TPA: SDR family NAD(P)-dependent oxidoreductase, partial [Pseudonocardia sp.]|nr:SDR family NAD(P)-dependent oxidoreductase [Pseudonocardia sp.]
MTAPTPGPTPGPTAGHALLTGKVVVVTAAAGTGIGAAAAERALAEGANVVVSDHHERRLKETAARLGEAHGADRVHALACDVTMEEQVQALLAGAAEAFGRVDVMVNNAGLGGTRSVLEMPDEEWHRVL